MANTFKFEITVQAGQISTSLTNFRAVYKLSALGVGHDYWTNGKSDGGDLRAFLGSNPIPLEVVKVDQAGKDGEIHFLCNSIDVGSVVSIEYGDSSLSQPAVANSIGRNSVWTDYDLVWHGGNLVDSSGNHTPTEIGSLVLGGLNGDIGEATDFDGSSQLIDAGTNNVIGSQNRTLTARVNPDLANEGGILGLGVGVNTERWAVRRKSGALRLEIGGSGETTALLLAENEWSYVGAVLNGTTFGDHTLYVDNASATLTGAAVVNTASNRVHIGDIAFFNGVSDPFDGGIEEVKLRIGALSSDYIQAEKNNQEDSSVFFSVSAQQSIAQESKLSNVLQVAVPAEPIDPYPPTDGIRPILSSIEIGTAQRTLFVDSVDSTLILNQLDQSVEITKELGGKWTCGMEFMSGTPIALSDDFHLERRRVVRLYYDDQSFQEWRIIKVTRSISGSKNVSVLMEPLFFDLDSNRIRRRLPTGQSMLNIPFYSTTVYDLLSMILSVGYNCPSIFKVGFIDSSIANTVVSVLSNNNTHLEIISELCEVLGAEWDAVYDPNDDSYAIRMVELGGVGGGDSQANLRPIQMGGDIGNRIELTKEKPDGEFFSRIIPVGGEDQNSFGIGNASFKVLSAVYTSGTDRTQLVLREPAIQLDGLLVGYYFGNSYNGYFEIVQTIEKETVIVSGDATELQESTIIDSGNSDSIEPAPLPSDDPIIVVD